MSDIASKKVRMPIEAPSPDKENVRHYSGNSGNRQRNFAYRKYDGFEDNVRRGDEQRRYNRNRRGNGDHDYYSKRQGDYGRRKEDQGLYEGRRGKEERIPVHTRIVKMKASVHTSKSAPSDVSTTRFAASTSKLMETPQKINKPDRTIKVKPRDVNVSKDPKMIKRTSLRLRNLNDSKRPIDLVDVSSDDEIEAACVPIRGREDPLVPTKLLQSMKLSPKKVITSQPTVVPPTINFATLAANVPLSNDNQIAVIPPSITEYVESVCEAPKNEKFQEKEPLVGSQPTVVPPTINFATLVANVPFSNDIQVATIPPSICETPKNEMIQETEPLTQIGTDHCLKFNSLSGGVLHANCDQLKVEAPVTNTPPINFALLGNERVESIGEHELSQVGAQIGSLKSTSLSRGVSDSVGMLQKDIPVSSLPTINFASLGEPIAKVEKVAPSPIGSFTKTDISAPPIKSLESTLSPLTTTVESVKKRPMLQVDEPSPHVEIAFNRTPNISKAWKFGDGLKVKMSGDKEPVLREEKTEVESFGKRRKLANEEPRHVELTAEPIVAPNPNSFADDGKVVLPSFDFATLLPDAQLAVPCAQQQVQEIPAVLPVKLFAQPPFELDTLVPSYQFALSMPTLEQQQLFVEPTYSASPMRKHQKWRAGVKKMMKGVHKSEKPPKSKLQHKYKSTANGNLKPANKRFTVYEPHLKLYNQYHKAMPKKKVVEPLPSIIGAPVIQHENIEPEPMEQGFKSVSEMEVDPDRSFEMECDDVFMGESMDC